MAFFQVPDGRKLSDASSGLGEWPQSTAGYRMYLVGSGGDEKIGIHIGQTIELQLTGGKGCIIEDLEVKSVRKTFRSAGLPDPEISTSTAWVTDAFAKSDAHRFKLTGDKPGTTWLFASDSAGNEKARLQVSVGNFEYHTDLMLDLIAETCRGGDALKIHALQRMLYNEYLGKDSSGKDLYSNGDNIFEQNSASNYHPTYKNMTCGIVCKARGGQVFDKLSTVADDWYLRALHEPVYARIGKRTDLKYRPDRIRALESKIIDALRQGQAVRVGVVDAPTIMSPRGGSLVAYDNGGHTVLIVGAKKTDTMRFLYIDPWGGGSAMVYKGGIPGHKFPRRCAHLGFLMSTHDPERKVKAGDTGNNIIRQDPATASSFNYAGGDHTKGNFLEVVSAPFA